MDTSREIFLQIKRWLYLNGVVEQQFAYHFSHEPLVKQVEGFPLLSVWIPSTEKFKSQSAIQFAK